MSTKGMLGAIDRHQERAMKAVFPPRDRSHVSGDCGMSETLSNEGLATYLGLSPEDAEKARNKDPAGWERFRSVAAKFIEVELWDQGIGPLPSGVIVCGPREVREGRGPVRRPRRTP